MQRARQDPKNDAEFSQALKAEERRQREGGKRGKLKKNPGKSRMRLANEVTANKTTRSALKGTAGTAGPKQPNAGDEFWRTPEAQRNSANNRSRTGPTGAGGRVK